MDYDKKYYDLILNYVVNNAERMFQPANRRFKYPFIDPSSVYEGSLWDWDSFWAVYSLAACQEATGNLNFNKKLIEAAEGNVKNFFDYQLEDGYIPMMVNDDKLDEGWEPYLIRKHKEGMVLNMHKPFLCQQACLVSGLKKSFNWLQDYIGQLEKYFECYDRYYLNKKCGLYVWADDVMIGMDNDPATFGRPRFSTANIFLNAFMVVEFNAMAKILNALGRKEKAGLYINKAKGLSGAIQRECYDPKDRFFYSVDVDIKTRPYDWFHRGLGVFWNTLPIKIQTWTGFIPLYAKIATVAQAEIIVKLHMDNYASFNCEYGIRSLAKDEKMYNLDATSNPSNWLGPVWIIVNYVAFRALMNYGYFKEAEKLYLKTLNLLGKDFEQTGTLHEYYSPETGKPIMNGDFLNWNILVLNMAAELDGGSLIYESISM